MPSKKSPSATPFCKVCFQAITSPNWRTLFGESVPLCNDCLREMNPRLMQWALRYKGYKIPVRAVYFYNQKIRSMYGRWAERHGFTWQVLAYEAGEEAGLKSAVVKVSGHNAYGLLKGEKGVHRLVRISPFDANARRHTSFASVNVVPEFGSVSDVAIDPKDLKVDTFRSGGAGGQNVNKVSSAVRITHLPTGIVVQCEIERSQLMNKATCMEMLADKLMDPRKRQTVLAGVQESIDFPENIDRVEIYPDVIPTIKALHERGRMTAVVSGNNEIHIGLVLKRFHLTEDFAFVVGYSPFRQPKPSGDPIFEARKLFPSFLPGQLVYIGDSLQDPLTAKNGGTAGILLERNHEYPAYRETKISTLAALLK